MSSSSTPDERKAELEKKRQKLAEIRAEKQRKEAERRQKLLEHQQNKDKGGDSADSGPAASNEDMDKLLSEVGISPERPAKESSPLTGLAAEGNKTGGSSPYPARNLFGASGNATLAKAEITQVNYAPKDYIAYPKSTQTDVEGGGREFHHGDGGSMDFWEDDALGRNHGGSQESTQGSDVFNLDESPTQHLAGILPHIAIVKPTEVPSADSDACKAVVKPAAVPFTEEEKSQIVANEEFLSFFDRASRVMERALCEQVDIFVDYSRDETSERVLDAGVRLSVNRCFVDDIVRGRVVTCLDYSPQHPELIVASYDNNPSMPSEPEGCVLVWNTKFKKDTPEYVFYSQSRVTSVSFGKFHPNLILGGTYSGRICLWDNRQHKTTPVQRSPLSTTAHTQPVYSMAVIGTQNAHNLVTASTDGRMCTWSLDMLAQPQEILDLVVTKAGSRQVGVTCLSFPMNDVNNFLVGSEEGVVFSGTRHGSKAGVTESFEGHYAPITGVNFHSAVGQVDFSQLFLSCSFDWTVKLWSTKEPRALYSFEGHGDYVTDVAWSPVHPALFACVDGKGKVQLWNINHDTESPIVQESPNASHPVKACNKVLWLPNGTQLCVGDYGGRVWLYDVHEQVALPRPDEWTRLARTLADIKQAKQEAEELSSAMA